MADNIRDFAVFMLAIAGMCLLGVAARYFLLPYSPALGTLAGILVPITLYFLFRIWMRRR